MIRRQIEEELHKAAEEYPVITIIGPRQSGKTTLSKICFPDFSYANLENPEVRSLAAGDPKNFLMLYPAPLIINEIQNVPELLSWIQIIVDQKPELKAQYIL